MIFVENQHRPQYREVYDPGVTRGDESLTYRSAPGTGAGKTISQPLGYTAGLTDPVYHGLVQIKYMWYNELTDLLQQKPPTHPTGFQVSYFANLIQTPRLDVGGQPPRNFPRLVE